MEPAPKVAERAPVLCFSDYYLDLAGQSLFKQTGQQIELTWGEYRLLRAFVRQPGQVLSRDHLLQSLSGHDAEAYDRSIDMQVVRLRRKIEPDPKHPSLIIAVRRSGYKFVAQVKEVEARTVGSVPEANGPPAPAQAQADRRQVTTLCIELLSCNGFGTSGDPEELQSAIAAYRQQVTAVVAQHEGTVGHCVAGEVLAYFGHPVAQEHAAERAIHAALVLAEGLAGTSANRFPVRAGLATGLVVADPAGEVIGDAPGDAARMRSLAEAGQVVVTATTRQVGGQLFTYHAFQPVTANGVPHPATAWRVMGPRPVASRSEALYRGKPAPLIGRVEEQTLLLHAWQQVKSGEGRAVLLTGEPGIGKTRLLKELEAWLATDKHASLRYFCSPLHQGTALHPIIAHWEQEAGFARGDTSEQRLSKLEALLAPDAFSPAEVALLAGMLGIATGERFAQPDLSPQRRREQTFAVLQRRPARIARRQPVLMLFEDVHWADLSSLEWLDMVVGQITEHPILLVISFRSEISPSWIGHVGVSLITLTRLDRRHSMALAVQVAEERALSHAVIERIIVQTDGVPLFIEEMTKAILETAPDGSPPAFAVPSTLQALLMARLDRLGPEAKHIAQTGAAVGREFSFELIASVTDLAEPKLRDALDRLTNAGLVFVRGVPPDSNYIFKHALVQEAAYSTLLHGRRQQLHNRIVATLEDRFPEIARTRPALLAQHCSEAGLVEKAVVYWLKAGQQALAASAMAEAVVQLGKGLHLLAGLADGPWRRQQELDLQIALGTALIATKGPAAADAGEALARARALAEQLDRTEDLVSLVVGQWVFHLVRGEHRLSLSLAEHLKRNSEFRNDETSRLLACYLSGHSRFQLGEFMAARALFERCMGLADPTHRAIGGLFFDRYAVMLGHLAMTLTYLGYLDEGRSRMDEALSEARRLKHVHTLAHVLTMVNWLDEVTRSPEVHIDEVLALSTEHGFAYYLSLARGRRARSLISLGQTQEGFALLKLAVAEFRATGAVSTTPQLFNWLAEAYTVLGQPDEALKCLGEAARVIDTTEERYAEAEYAHRLPGDLMNAKGDRFAAERNYLQAIAVAEGQSAKLLQLRASTSLARLWREQGRRAEAHDLLDPVYNWFTEGFAAADLRDAKALLDELALDDALITQP